MGKASQAELLEKDQVCGDVRVGLVDVADDLAFAAQIVHRPGVLTVQGGAPADGDLGAQPAPGDSVCW